MWDPQNIRAYRAHRIPEILFGSCISTHWLLEERVCLCIQSEFCNINDSCFIWNRFYKLAKLKKLNQTRHIFFEHIFMLGTGVISRDVDRLVNRSVTVFHVSLLREQANAAMTTELDTRWVQRNATGRQERWIWDTVKEGRLRGTWLCRGTWWDWSRPCSICGLAEAPLALYVQIPAPSFSRSPFYFHLAFTFESPLQNWSNNFGFLWSAPKPSKMPSIGDA